MVHEKLMQELPKDVERVPNSGTFYIRNNSGSYSVVVLTEVLVTCGGKCAKESASNLASKLNKAWEEHMSLPCPCGLQK